MKRLTLVSVVAVITSVVLAGPAHAATLCVNPGGTGGCFASIQAAIDAAAPNTSINVAAGTYEPFTIPANTPLTLRGAGSTRTIVDGEPGQRVAFLLHSSSATISRVTLRGGASGITNFGTLRLENSRVTENANDGGIVNFGSLTVVGTLIDRNSRSIGGGIANIADATVERSRIVNNVATWGGGISQDFGTLTVIDSLIAHNAAEDGGGLYNGAADLVTIVRSTISGNHASGEGGGIWTFNPTDIANSTISANTAETGGGIWAGFPQVGLTNSTLSGNSATTGGGVFATSELLTASDTSPNVLTAEAPIFGVVLTNSIVANSPIGGDCVETSPNFIEDGGHSVDSDSTCGLDPALGSLSGVDPLLGPLADNGGPTPTLALLAGSPAIDAGDNATCLRPGIDNIDQRGLVRITEVDPVCDIGAYEG